MSVLRKLGVAFIGMIVVGAVFSATADKDHKPEKPINQLVKDEKDKKYARDIINAARVVSLSKAVRDPSSFRIIGQWDFPEKDTFCIQYRAKNGFGGYSVEYAVFWSDKVKAGSPRQIGSTWNNRCVSQRKTK